MPTQTKTKILYLSYDGLTDPLGQSQILPYISELTKRGFVFTIISFEKPISSKRGSELIRTQCESNGIRWIPLKYHKRPPILSTLIDLTILWFKIKGLDPSKEFDIIHCRSYITALIGLRAKQKWGTKFVFDMRGFWADERVDGNLWNLKNPIYNSIYNYFKKQEQRFLRQADAIVTLTLAAKEIVKTWSGREDTVVIPCCVDTDLFNPCSITSQAQSELRLQLKLHDDDFVLIYLGSIGTWYLLNEMLDLFREIKKFRPKSKFLIITKEDKDKIFENADRRGVDKTAVIVAAAERNQVPYYISLADFSVLFIKPAFSKLGSSPTKVGELLAMNIPIIANTGIGDNDTLLGKDPYVFLVKDFTPLSYQALINKMFNFKKRNSEIREAAINRFSIHVGVDSYERIYNDLC